AEVVAPGEARPPVRRGRGGPEAPPAVARVERGGVDLLAGQVGTAHLPALAGPIAGVEEQPLRGADDDERAVAARDVARFRHAGKCSMAARMRGSLFVVALLAAPARADQPLDYIEKIFGATNVNAVAGHGALTAGFSEDGDLTVLSWPSPGFDDQLGYLTSNDPDARARKHFGAPDGMGSYLGLLVGGRVVWLRDLPHAQTYSRPDAPVPVTTFTGDGYTVTVTDVVAPDADTLTRHVRVVGVPAQLVVYENLSPSLSRIPEVPVADWALDPHNDFL